MSRIFRGANEKSLRLWNSTWLFFTLASGALLAARAYGHEKSKLRIDSTGSSGNTIKYSSLEPQHAIVLISLGILLLFIFSITDFIIQYRKGYLSIKKSIDSLVFDSDVSELERLRKKSLFILFWSSQCILASFLYILYIISLSLLDQSFLSSVKTFLKDTLKLEWKYEQWFTIGASSYQALIFLCTLIQKIKFRVCLSKCMCLYRDKNLCYFFCANSGVSKSWSRSIGFFTLFFSSSTSLLIGLGGFGTIVNYLKTKLSLQLSEDYEQLGHEDWAYRGMASGALILLILSICSLIYYSYKPKKTVKIGLKNNPNDYEQTLLKKLNRITNSQIAIASISFIFVLLGCAGLVLIEKSLCQKTFIGSTAQTPHNIATGATLSSLFVPALMSLPRTLLQKKSASTFREVEAIGYSINPIGLLN